MSDPRYTVAGDRRVTVLGDVRIIIPSVDIALSQLWAEAYRERAFADTYRQPSFGQPFRRTQ